MAAAALALVLAGCSTGGSTAEPAAGYEAQFLAAHDLAGMDAREIVDHLDRLGPDERPTDLFASVRPDELLLSSGDQELTLAMPEDQYYLSVAPYVDRTHECFYHSLTTCLGELSGEDIEVRVVDDGTGDVLVEEGTTTFDNGFVGIWLPRDVDGTVEVTYDGLTGATDFSTTADGATCVTTLRLT